MQIVMSLDKLLFATSNFWMQMHKSTHSLRNGARGDVVLLAAQPSRAIHLQLRARLRNDVGHNLCDNAKRPAQTVITRRTPGVLQQSWQAAHSMIASPVPAFKLLKQRKRLVALDHVAPMRVELAYDALRQPAHVQQLHIPNWW
jgi:hypothetical protein